MRPGEALWVFWISISRQTKLPLLYASITNKPRLAMPGVHAVSKFLLAFAIRRTHCQDGWGPAPKLTLIVPWQRLWLRDALSRRRVRLEIRARFPQPSTLPGAYTPPPQKSTSMGVVFRVLFIRVPYYIGYLPPI